ncbi:alternative oxidase-domain-containing protein [Catenaria anguillulae PL171]|uniref:Alternative oxidase n=1 Tax=Catenaria anguillulae PL171 TaxID=765915 RepID=A0A1Y2HXH5_9FUNG|nr:alternative oxidase-domain-containing protein [Catenaria anguillulae PL171]
MLYHVYPIATRAFPTRLVTTRGLHHLSSSTSTPVTFFRQHQATPSSSFSTSSFTAHESQAKSQIDSYHPQPMRPEFLTPVTPQQLETLDIGLTKHREPQDWRDKFALSMVKSMRVPADLFFRKKYIHRAVMLETVAGVPGMVGGMLRHLRSLRKLKHDGGWIAHLLHEAENERMHLMTFMKLSQPNIFERLLVTAVQGVFFNAFFLLYIVSPKTAHRVVGFLEEEAVISYTQFLQEIDAGRIPNVPAPEIAIEYWNLPKDAKLREVVLAVRADEAVHRDSNHHFADCITAGKDDLRTVHKVDQSVWVGAPKKVEKITDGAQHHGPVQPSA